MLDKLGITGFDESDRPEDAEFMLMDKAHVLKQIKEQKKDLFSGRNAESSDSMQIYQELDFLENYIGQA